MLFLALASFVSSEDIDNHVNQFQIDHHYELTNTLPGTRSYHSFIPDGLSKLILWRISEDSFSKAFQFDKATIEILINDIKVKNYFACIYINKCSICIAADIFYKKQDVHFKFMNKSQHNTFSWLRRNDFCWAPINHVFHSITSISVQGHGARSFKLNDEEYYYKTKTINKTIFRYQEVVFFLLYLSLYISCMLFWIKLTQINF